MDANPNDVFFPWYALYVKHKHEKKAAYALGARDIKTFLPTFRKTHGNGRSFEVSLFPGYVFCRIDVSNLLPIVSTPGVFGLVCRGSVPNSIPEEEIDSVRHLLATGLPIAPTEYFAPGQEIELSEGPLKGIRGCVLDASNDRWLVVSIHMLQRSVAVKLERHSVQAHA
jgi:transcription antitermination factor NusG